MHTARRYGEHPKRPRHARNQFIACIQKMVVRILPAFPPGEFSARLPRHMPSRTAFQLYLGNQLII